MSSLTLNRINQFFNRIESASFSAVKSLFGMKNNHGQLGYAKQNPYGDTGQVWLIGAGPGDAELLTLKAHRLIQQADVVMYDWLVNPDILTMIPAHVERIFVGKKCGHHSMQQKDICQLMVEVAKQGKQIVRLKGGDPAIFARAAEECDVLTENHIPFAIVPGITAASGASAYAGIPLTHRECAQSVRFVTAHMKSASDEPDWKKLVLSQSDSSGETLVFYMGLNRLEKIMLRMQEHGLAPLTPVAVIDQATSEHQQVCTSTAENIAEKVNKEAFEGPALIIIGEVVTKRQEIALGLLAMKHSQQVISSHV